MAIDAILDEVRSHGATHVVVTGGEPMIAEEITTLTERLKAAECSLERAAKKANTFTKVNMEMQDWETLNEAAD